MVSPFPRTVPTRPPETAVSPTPRLMSISDEGRAINSGEGTRTLTLHWPSRRYPAQSKTAHSLKRNNLSAAPHTPRHFAVRPEPHLLQHISAGIANFTMPCSIKPALAFRRRNPPSLPLSLLSLCKCNPSQFVQQGCHMSSYLTYFNDVLGNFIPPLQSVRAAKRSLDVMVNHDILNQYRVRYRSRVKVTTRLHCLHMCVCRTMLGNVTTVKTTDML